MTERLATFLANLALRQARAILWCSAVLAATALVSASFLRFDPDILNLVPQENREVNEFRRVLSEIGTIDYHVAVVRVPPGHDWSAYEETVETLGRRFEQSERIRSATWRLPDALQFAQTLLPNALLFLAPEDLQKVEQRLTDHGIRQAVARNRSMLQTPQASAMEPLVRHDPLNLLPVYLDRFRRAGSGFRIDASSGLYLSEDHSTFLILMRPVRPAQDVPFGRELMEESRAIARETLAGVRTGNDALEPPVIEFTGGYAIATGDADLIQKDVVSNVLFSFFGVLAIFLYGFRRVAAIGYAGIPMALALALTFGIAAAFFGVLSSASAGFAALLAGLGIDFNTVLYGRYVDERNRGASMEEALRATFRTTLPSVGVAAATTAATFFAFVVTDFQGMTQLGLLTGVGILLFLLCVSFVLPALIVVNEGGRRRRSPNLYHHSFGSEKLIAASVARPKRVVWIWIVFVALSAALGTRIRFSDDVQKLRATGNRGVEIQEELTRTFGQSFHSMMLVFYGDTPDEAIARTARALPDLDRLVQEGTIASYQSAASFVPPLEQQREAIEFIRDRPESFDPERIAATFAAALREEGFRPGTYDAWLEDFRRALRPERALPVSELLGRGAAELSGRFLHSTGAGWMSVVYLNPVGGAWPREVDPAILALGEKHPDATLTGVNLVSGTLRRIVRSDAIRATLLGTAAVFLLMFAAFRRLGVTLLTFVPFVAGATGMVGLMALFDLELNFMNVFVGLMIVGVATDYAIYMLKRWLEDHDMFVDGAAAETAKSISMAAVTTIVGYGSFAFSHYPGLRSIGYASTFGIALSALATITLLPAILTLARRRSGESVASSQ